MPVSEVLAFASPDDAVSKAELWHVYFRMASEKKEAGGEKAPNHHAVKRLTFLVSHLR